MTQLNLDESKRLAEKRTAFTKLFFKTIEEEMKVAKIKYIKIDQYSMWNEVSIIGLEREYNRNRRASRTTFEIGLSNAHCSSIWSPR
jgi:hypothetical protein